MAVATRGLSRRENRRERRHDGSRSIDPRWVWFSPLFVFLLIGLSPLFGLPKVTFGLIGLALVIIMSRFPGVALIALAWFLPFQIPVSSWLYERGVAGVLLQPAGSIKEALLLSLLVAAWREGRAKKIKLDALDKMILVYVGIILLYLVFPQILSTDQFYLRSFGTRLLGFRVNAGFPLALLAARHAPIDARWRRRFMTTIVFIGAIFAAGAVYQFTRPAPFTDFVANTLNIPRYSFEVLKIPYGAAQGLLAWPKARPVRVGSFIVDPFTFADFMLIPAGVLLAWFTMRAPRVRELVFLGVIGGAILASQTRANILALGIMVLVSLAPSRTKDGKRNASNQIRIAAIVGLAVIAFIPSLASSRIGGGTEDSATSNEGHLDEIRGGISVLQAYPLGLGLGSAPSIAARDPNAPLVISDNSLLQVGNELGVVMMFLFIIMLFLVMRTLWRAARGSPNTVAMAAFLTLTGLLIAGELHHVFQVFAVSWVVFAMAGLGLQAAESDSRESDEAELVDADGAVYRD